MVSQYPGAHEYGGGHLDEHGAATTFTGKEVFFTASLVLEDIDLPEQSFTISGYFQVWWKDTPREGLDKWGVDRVARWVHHNVTDLVGPAHAEAIAQSFAHHHVNGAVFERMNGNHLKDLGISMVGIRELILLRRDKYVKETMSHMADDSGYIHDVEHLKAPFNWEDMFYNATSEEFLTEPLHKRLTNPASVTRENPEGRQEVIWGLYHMRSVCLETMELDKFPLDQQFLDLRLTADRWKFKWQRERPEWVPKESEGVSILGNNNDQIFQVRMSEKLVGEYNHADPLVDFETNNDALLLRIRVSRRIEYYINHVFLPIFLIVLSSLGGFAIELDSLPERIGVTCTMFLVVIAYQYVVNEMLPTSSTTTLLDHYVTMSIVLMTVLVFQNASLMLFNDPEDAIEYDKYCVWIITVGWCVYHLIIYFFMDVLRLSWQQTAGEDDFEEEWLPRTELGTLFCNVNKAKGGLIEVVDAKFKDVTRKIGFI